MTYFLSYIDVDNTINRFSFNLKQTITFQKRISYLSKLTTLPFVGIGSFKNSKVILCSGLNLTWERQTFDLLGVTFSTNLQKIPVQLL